MGGTPLAASGRKWNEQPSWRLNLGSVAVLRRIVVGALVAAMNREARMMVIGLGALLVFGGVLYMVRAVIWRGSLPRSGPVRMQSLLCADERTSRDAVSKSEKRR